MILQFLNSIIYFFTFWYRYFFWYQNYHIKDVQLTIDNSHLIKNVVIQKENNFEHVKESVLFFIKYYFKNREYIYVTRKKVFVWPPSRTKNGLIFNLPVKYAAVVDEHGVEQFDVTKHVQKYAGPFNDFHEETILLKDIEGYYPTLKLTNVLDQTVTIGTDDTIHHQTLWRPCTN